jgi:hypothetical protein
MLNSFAAILAMSVSKGCDRHPTSALILRRGFESDNVRMTLQQIRNRIAEGPGAGAMNDPHLRQLRKKGFVEELVCAIRRFVHSAPQQVNLVRRGFRRRHSQVNTRRQFQRRLFRYIQIRNRPSQSNIPYEDFGFITL